MTEVSYPISTVCLSMTCMLSIREVTFNYSWQSLFRKTRKHYYLSRWWLGTPDFLIHTSKYMASNEQIVREAFCYTDCWREYHPSRSLSPPSSFHITLMSTNKKKAENISIFHLRCQFDFTSFDLLFLLNWVRKFIWFKGWLRGQVLCFPIEKPGLLHNSAT